MFDPEFFPTPRAVIYRMLDKLDKDACHFLDPSAGKGDIAECISERRRYRQRDVDCIEQSPELVAILHDKGYPVVGFDWLTYDGVCYYDAIVMNPPFSSGCEHLLKAWDFMHNGEIVCLLNAETIRNPYTASRQRLAAVIEEAGEVEFLGKAFQQAERKTDAEVALVYLQKVNPEDANEVWETSGQEKDHGDEAPWDNLPALRDQLGNMQHYFEMANHHVIEAFRHLRKADSYMRGNNLSIGKYEDAIKAGTGNFSHGKAEFIRKHRKEAWKAVFERTEFHKWLDKKQQDELVRDIERNGNIPFTAANICGTLENIFLQRNKLFLRSVANVFDELRKYHPDNVHHTEGWKSNSSYKINKKIVFPYGCNFGDYGSRKFSLRYGGGSIDIYADLDRVMCGLAGRDFSQCRTIGGALDTAFKALGWNVVSPFYNQATSEFFDIKFFMKGTVHLTFRDEKLWHAFNVAAADGRAEIGEDHKRAA